MSHPVKPLSQKDRQEIFSELERFQAMAYVLGQDFERSSRELAANPNDHFLWRSHVRFFAAFVEGNSHLMKQGVLRLHEPLQVHLSTKELTLLKGQRPKQDGQPEMDASGTPKRGFLPFDDNLKFAVTMFARLTGSNYTLTHGSVEHEAFKRTIRIRDRLMHPKAVEDLYMQVNEMQDLQVAWRWYNAETCCLLKDSIVRLNQRFADISQPSGDASEGPAGEVGKEMSGPD